MSDLRQRVPGHALIEKLLDEWDAGRIHRDESGRVVIDDAARGWYDGVLGERRVARQLASLGPMWTVLHSVPVGMGSTDIDHVAIGPSGVFTINTKRHPGMTVTAGGLGMRLDGFGVRYIAKSVAEARRAAELLERACGLVVPVVGILAFVDPAGIVLKAPLGEDETEVRALRDRDLLPELLGRRTFSDEQVSRIAEAAALPTTWSRRRIPPTLGDHIAREFEALEAAVGPQLAAPPRRPRPTRATRTSQGTRRHDATPRTTPLERLLIGVIPPLALAAIAWAVVQALLSR